MNQDSSLTPSAAVQSAPVWVEVNTKALAHNARQARSVLQPGTELLAVVKADAYGHGMLEAAKAFVQGGATYLGVAHLQAACELAAQLPQVPVLAWLWEPVSGAQLLPRALELGVEVCVSSIEQLQVLAKVSAQLNTVAKLHVKVDTGMGRNGILPADLPQLLEILAGQELLEVTGMMSHLYFADGQSPAELATVTEQAQIFHQCRQVLEAGLGKKVLAHLANSAAIQRRKDLHFDLVRAGIALYGYAPVADGTQLDLRRALTVKSRLALVKEVLPGQKVGYGALYEAQQKERLALIPYGYADGLPRHLTHHFKVAVSCESGIYFAPQVGRVSMDQIVVRLPEDCPAQAGDEVTIWGVLPQFAGECELSDAADLAREAGTISYELLTSVSTRLPRIYVQGAID